jgi:hypothetical protein
MNASYNKLHALRSGLAAALVSFALLAVSAQATLNAGATTRVACQAGFCGG